MNANKTEVQIFERNEERTEYKISVNGKILQVNKLVYLEIYFSRDERYEMDAGNIVYGAFSTLKRLQNVNTTARLAVHKAVLVPTLLYSSETWVLQKKNERKILKDKCRGVAISS